MRHRTLIKIDAHLIGVLTMKIQNCIRFAVAVLLIALPAPLLAQERIGAFIYQSNRDEMTDARSDFAMIASEEAGPRVVLAWRCVGDGLVVVFLKPQEGFTPYASYRVQWRFDSHPARVALWDGSRTAKNLIAPDAIVAGFTATARSAASVKIRYTPKFGGSETYTFPLDGASRAIRRLPCAQGL
jgi:hypothetical protein